MKFHFRTLGCKMNWLDSARIQAALQSGGHHVAEDENDADIIFINSCTVTGRADRQSRQETSHAQRLKKQVAIFGCGPKVDPTKWKNKFPGALVFQNEKNILEYFHISPDQLEFPLHDRTRLPVAIQTGCDNKCTFCITRIARGKTEDFPIQGILRQIKRAEENGIQEIVLTGIQLASWGCENSEKYPEKSQLPELLHTILEKTTIPRIRMSSLGPQFLQKRFFQIFQNPRICDHLHLSIQSGSPEILKKMNRGHSIEEVFFIAQEAKKVRPEVALTSDIIVGFPGEREQDFLETVQMTEKIGLSKIHVFPFSPREGTGAANFPDHIHAAIKKERAQYLRRKGDILRKKFITSQIGRIQEVLVEDYETGYSKNYIRLKAPGAQSGERVRVQIQEDTITQEK